jgi:hypothetical protein
MEIHRAHALREMPEDRGTVVDADLVLEALLRDLGQVTQPQRVLGIAGTMPLQR